MPADRTRLVGERHAAPGAARTMEQCAVKTARTDCVCSGAQRAPCAPKLPSALADRTHLVGRGCPLPALHRRNQRAVDKTRMAPPICHCEEAAGRRGALSAKREEVPLGCNLGEAVAISPMAFLLSGRVLRDCHVASLLAMTRQGGTAVGTVQRTELAVLLPLRGRAGHAPPLQGQCGFNGGRCESAVPSRDCHGPFGASQ